MTLARNIKTGIVDDFPDNIINHRILGRNLEVVDPDGEYEEDKVVIDKKVKTVKTPKVETVTDDEQEPVVTFFSDEVDE